PLLREPGRTGVLHPSYAEHAYAWQRAGHAIATLTVAELDTAVDRLDVLVVVNPNNPTGLRFAPETLLRWRERLARRDGWLVIDEAFMDATPNDSLTGRAGAAGLIILRSLGKFFGLAGARVGFVLAEPAVRERLQNALGPWTISGPARWVATQALKDRRWQAEMRNCAPAWGERLAELLKRQRLPVAGGAALFQWVPLPEAEFWQDALARRGILVRRFTDPPGLRFGLPGDEPAWRRLEWALTGIRAERLTH
ncbi:MAG: aminotransferase class I/II-fold pyridoxal phosphate-dependent enzyme, partial [Candidatus Competibacteraceae bacterium]|nr:aminotransferase class I/II-fold pyridoxal phosphate-dependent enzyme [Candidatus Competibacteraceae bacterium]